jgi:benzoate membrane transport protein
MRSHAEQTLAQPYRSDRPRLADVSPSAIIAGAVAVLIAYTGPMVVVVQAAHTAHLSQGHLVSWIWAISVGSGITCIVMSLVQRAPVIAAWSTPGAALLVSGLLHYSFAEAVGAYLVSAALTVAVGLSGLFGALMRRIPEAVAAAALAGILLEFGLGGFTALQHRPVLVGAMLAAFVVATRIAPRYNVVTGLIVGLVAAALLGMLHFPHIRFALVRPELTVPVFSLRATLGLAIPLFLVTMASQNAPGVAVMRAAGYDVLADRSIWVTGAASGAMAPFGGHTINLAAITAAICAGPDAHPDPQRRYVAGVACGAFYIAVGSFGATTAALFAGLPQPFIAGLAAIALFAPLMGGLTTAMRDEQRRSAALITFLVTGSGITMLGVGSAFWGLVLGIAVVMVTGQGRERTDGK